MFCLFTQSLISVIAVGVLVSSCNKDRHASESTITPHKQNQDGFYQIAMKNTFPGAPDGYLKVSQLCAKANFKKINLTTFEQEVKKIEKLFRSVINYDPPDNGPILHGAIVNLEMGERTDRQRAYIELLLKYGADPNLKYNSIFHQTPSHYIVIANDVKLCEIMMKAGADVHAVDIYGRSVLQIAKETGEHGKNVYDCMLKWEKLREEARSAKKH